MALKIIERELITDNAINAAKVEDGTIVAADLTANTITNADVKSDAAIAASKIAGLATSATTDTTNASNIATGTLPTARLDTGTTANKIVILDGNAKLPAISGASLTGVESFTKSASDPTISTNPSGGVGTEWVNTTNGEIFICTDATAGENVWTNVGAGTGDITPYAYQGTQYGYRHGGENTAGGNSNIIEKFSFTTDGNSTDVGNLTTTGAYDSGFHSTTYGYRQGTEGANVIDKYAFAADGNATDVGDMPSPGEHGSATGVTSQTYGYVCGGYTPSGAATINSIRSVSFSTDGNAVDVADMSTTSIQASNSTDTVNGYIMAGAHGESYKSRVDKFVYATQANATEIGDMTVSGYRTGGCSSLTYGYCTGGMTTPSGTKVNVIDKFNFSGSFTATDVGNLDATKLGCTGSSSGSYGYYAGGTPPTSINVIGKFPFASDTNATDVGDLTAASQYGAGTSY